MLEIAFNAGVQLIKLPSKVSLSHGVSIFLLEKSHVKMDINQQGERCSHNNI